MNCDLWQDKFDAFVDMELTPGEARDFEEHLRACPACSAEALARQRLKSQTRLAGQRFVPDAEFEKRIIQKTAAPTRMRWTWLPALATVAAVLAMVLGGLIWRQRTVEHQLVSQLVDQHVATMASANPVDVVSTDAHTVKPWFQGKVPFSVDVPDLHDTQFTLVGGRVEYFQQNAAAQLIFAVRQHRISVFIFRDGGETRSLGDQTYPIRRMGFETQSWAEDGIRYFAISDVNPQDIRQLCDLLKRRS
jgi:anti-sigma factor RsiW